MKKYFGRITASLAVFMCVSAYATDCYYDCDGAEWVTAFGGPGGAQDGRCFEIDVNNTGYRYFDMDLDFNPDKDPDTTDTQAVRCDIHDEAECNKVCGTGLPYFSSVVRAASTGGGNYLGYYSPTLAGMCVDEE